MCLVTLVDYVQMIPTDMGKIMKFGKCWPVKYLELFIYFKVSTFQFDILTENLHHPASPWGTLAWGPSKGRGHSCRRN